ncbi:hypothetical protein BH23BAC1_BH23BAC1_23870 [soil metagenome]
MKIRYSQKKGLVVTSFFFLLIMSCQSDKGREKEMDLPNSGTIEIILNGKNLAVQVCGNCHLFPNPELLDKQTWREHVLPQMSLYSGIYFDGRSYKPKIPENFYKESSYGDLVSKLQLYPDSALISLQEWLQIENYYYEMAPEVLPAPPEDPGEQNPSNIFSGVFPPFTFDNSYASTTLLHFDQASRLLYLGDNRTSTLYILNSSFQVINKFPTGSAPVKVLERGGQLYILTMGSFEAKGTQEGKLLFIKNGNISTLIEGLERPVDFAIADLNGDGEEEILIAGFGSFQGNLSWYQKTTSGYKKNVLYNGPGATKIYTKDLNNNGRTDIAVLIAHGMEGIFFFMNEGNSSFSQKKIIEVPPVYGSTYFTFADMNSNGLEDIIYVNGDNADLSPILKPYHGIRIFQNKGGFQYEETHFISIHGAYKAICDDFNQDGQMDIAVVSFFPDYVLKPEAGFLLLLQGDNETFNPHLLPEAREGRWISMTSGDFSGDGNPQLLLGAHLLTQGPPVPIPLRNLWGQKKRTLLKISKSD